MKVAIIGGGAAGMVTAYLLDKTHAVTVFEKQPILGGNIRTLNKNVQVSGVEDGVFVDNGVIEFQRDHFVNFHRLMAQLGVETETISGGSSSFYLANGHYVLGPAVVANSGFSLLQKLDGYRRLLPIALSYKRHLGGLQRSRAALKDLPLSYFLHSGNWHLWQKMLMMYAYSIPLPLIDDVPAEMAVPVLRQSGKGTKWTRIIGGVYSYIEAILAQTDAIVRTGVTIKRVERSAESATIHLTNSESYTFDKVVFATPPDQVLKLLAHPTEDERRRFGAWQANHATTIIHTDMTMYERFGVTTFTEFDVFEKPNGDGGYNAYLNRLSGLPDTAPHYNLAYNLTDWIRDDKIIQSQDHHTPLYTVEAFRYRHEVIATNGENNTYHAGAYLGNGLHEGAVSSALAVSHLLGGKIWYS